jgi:probable HAF family extracellular repeat protein
VDGTLTDLGNLGGIDGPAGNHACSINNAGQVVGHATLADGSFHAFLWTKRSGMVDLYTLPGDAASLAIGINDRGQVVGASLDGDFNPSAVIWDINGKISNLNSLIPDNSKLQLLVAFSINAAGEIIGIAVNTKTGEPHGFLATPKP